MLFKGNTCLTLLQKVLNKIDKIIVPLNFHLLCKLLMVRQMSGYFCPVTVCMGIPEGQVMFMCVSGKEDVQEGKFYETFEIGKM